MAAKQAGTTRRIVWAVVILVIAACAVGVGIVVIKMPPRAERLRRKGMKRLQLGRNAEAVRYLTEALEADPDHPHHLETRERLINAYTAQKQFDTAFAEIEKARKHGLAEPEAARLKARVYVGRANYRLASAGRQLSASLCEDVIAHELAPATKLCLEHENKVADRAEMLIFLGDLYRARERSYLAINRLHRDAARDARATKRHDQWRDLSRRAELARGRAAWARAQAAAAYSKALERDSDSVSARIKLAGMLLRNYIPSPRAAKDLIQSVIAKDPSNRAARLLLADAEQLLDNPEGALAILRGIPNDQGGLGVRVMEAEVLGAMGRWREVDQLLAADAATQSRNNRVALLRGRALLTLGKPAEALLPLQNIFADGKTRSPEARYLLAQALLAAGKEQQGLSSLHQVLSDAEGAAPLNWVDRRRLRSLRFSACRDLAERMLESAPDAAAKFARQAAQAMPENPEALDLARKILAPYAEEGEIATMVLNHVAALTREAGAEAGLAAAKEEIKRPGAPVERLQVLMARIHYERGAYAEAIAAYERVRKTSPEKAVPALELANLLTQVGKYDEALVIYRDLEKRHPEFRGVQTGELRALIAAGRVDDAVRLLEAHAGKGGGGLRQILMGLYVQGGRLEDAVALARAHAQARPSDSVAYGVLGELLLKTGRLEEARDALQQTRRLDAASPMAFLEGLVDLIEGKPDAAVSCFRDARKRFPQRLSPRLYLAVALQAAGKAEQGVGELEGVLAPRHGRDRQWDFPRWVLAVLYAGGGQGEAAEEMNKLIAGSEAGLQAERGVFLRRLVEMPEEARLAAAREANLAFVFRHAGLPKVVGEHAVALARQGPASPLPRCWLGQAYEKEGQQKKALEEYRAVAAAFSGSATAKIALAGCQQKAGDTTAAARTMEEALALTPGEERADLHSWLGRIYQHNDQPDDAIRHYRATLQARPDDVYVLNNLALLLATRENDPAAALPFADRALKVGLREPYVLDTVGWVCALSGDLDRARRLLEEAKVGNPTHPSIRFHLGMTYLKLGQKDQAKAEIKEALALDGTFEEAEEARRVLQSL